MKIDEVRQVLQMYVATMTDMFRAVATASSREELDTVQTQMVSLQDYVFDALCKIYHRFGSTAIPTYARNARRLERLDTFTWVSHTIVTVS